MLYKNEYKFLNNPLNDKKCSSERIFGITILLVFMIVVFLNEHFYVTFFFIDK